MRNIVPYVNGKQPGMVFIKSEFQALTVKFIAFSNRFGVVLSPKNGITFWAWMLQNEPWWTWPPQPTPAHPSPPQPTLTHPNPPSPHPPAHLHRRLNLNALVMKRASYCDMNVKKKCKTRVRVSPHQQKHAKTCKNNICIENEHVWNMFLLKMGTLCWSTLLLQRRSAAYWVT